MTKEDKSYLNVDVPISKMEYGADYQERMAIWDELWSPNKAKVLPKRRHSGVLSTTITPDESSMNVLHNWKNMKKHL